MAQCPEITETATTPDCNPQCELCEGEVLTIRLKGFDLPNGGKIDYYYSDVPGFNPYNNQGIRMGSANIVTPGGNCRICPELLGFIIDACGTEAQNEFIVIWTGSGFNTSNFVFDFDANNNFGAGNGDIGSSCGIAPGPAGLVGCMATSVGGGFNLPGNAIWIVFTSSGPNYAYDFSAVCGLGLKVFVSMNSCSRSSGAFSNGTSTGLRTQTMSINGCACAASVTYDTDDPSLIGNGDAWAGGLTNGGCAASITGPGSYTPAVSIVDPFSFTIPQTWCGKKYEIVGIINPKPDPLCCMEEFTERLEVSVTCPKANPASLEVCDNGNGRGTFYLEDAESEILGPGGNGIVEWYRNQNGSGPISSPYDSPSGTIYARVLEGRCRSALVPVTLKANPLPSAKAALSQVCEERLGLALFKLTDLISIITNNTPNLKVRFFEDPDLLIEIIPPYLTGSTVIYATVSNAKCESLPVEVTLTVIPSPKANSVGDTLCDSGDGTAIFILSKLDSLITGGIKTDSVRYFEDSLGKIPLPDPFRSSGQKIWAYVYDNPCQSLPTPVSLIVSQPPSFNQLTEKACDEGNGTGIFDLKMATIQIQNGNPNVSVSYYSDSARTNLILPPILVYSIDTLYAFAQSKDCFSKPVELILEVIKRPNAFPVHLTKCGQLPNDQAEFDLEEVKNMVNNGESLVTEIYTDSTLNTIVQGKWIANCDTLFAITNNGLCRSNPVKVILKAIPQPDFSYYPDTSACAYFVMATLTGRNISQNAAYYQDSILLKTKRTAGDTLTKTSKIFLFDTIGPCLVTDSFSIIIQPEAQAGDDNQSIICEGTEKDLTDLIRNGNSGGQFFDPLGRNLLNGSRFNSSGLAGNQFVFLYRVDASPPCPGDTASLVIDVETQVSAGPDQNTRQCAESNPYNLEQLFGINGSNGIFIDPISTGALMGKEWHSALSGTGVFKILFITGDGIYCPKDSALLSLEINKAPDFQNISDLRGCDFILLPELSQEVSGPSSGYYSLPGGKGIKYQPGDTIRSSFTLYAYLSDPNEFCHKEDSLNVEIGKNISAVIQKDNLCPDEFLIIGSKRYDSQNPVGSEIIRASGPGECDSLLSIQLTFRPEAIYEIDQTLCQGEYLMINNERYDSSRPSGTQLLKGASSYGCDSIIKVDLKFSPIKTSIFQPVLCEKDSLIINGQTYHKFKTTGTDTLYGASSEGCDSIVSVKISIIQTGRLKLDSTICHGEFLLINGIRLDSTLPRYTSILKGAAANGCDSLVDLSLSFHPASNNIFKSTLCENQSLVINGNTYNIQNPQGFEIFKGGAYTGCDSILRVEIDFTQSVVSNYQTRLCKGDSIRIGAKVYSEFRTSGSDTLFMGSIAGCDSILIVNVNIEEPSYYTWEDTLCNDAYILIDGFRYDKAQPTGRQVLKNRNVSGCDSIININLYFKQQDLNYTSLFEIYQGEKVQFDLQASFQISSVRWLPSTNLSCGDCLNPEASPTENTEYQGVLTDIDGCEIFVRIKIVVRSRNDVYFPNSFSPNSDGVNDRFRIENPPAGLKVITFSIYDRWGNKVYSESNVSAQDMYGWDGRYKGQELMPGVYVFLLAYETPEGQTEHRSGDINLIR